MEGIGPDTAINRDGNRSERSKKNSKKNRQSLGAIRSIAEINLGSGPLRERWRSGVGNGRGKEEVVSLATTKEREIALAKYYMIM